MKRVLSLSIAACAFLGACTGGTDAELAKQAASAEHLRTYTEAIAHDSCEGRRPFTAGADRAVGYIARQMQAVGLQPPAGGSYLQQVPIVSSVTECPSPMVIQTPKQRLSPEWLEGFTAFSARIEPEIRLDKVPLFFAGYGIVAPEYGKNDYAGISHPSEKVAVVIVNDPGLGSTDSTYFKGDAMTYYGRWKYKFEEGDRQGVKGVLIIHDDRGAGYPWSVVRAMFTAKRAEKGGVVWSGPVIISRT